MTTHYDVLGLTPDASLDDIKRAYYERARTFHPDAHAGSSLAVLEEAQRAMSELNAAWNVLRDEILRSQYDHALSSGALSSGALGSGASETAAPARHALVGQGFHYWFASAPARVDRETGRTRLNLGVDRGTTDLSALRQLAPNRLWGLHAEMTALGDDQLVHLQAMRGLQLLDLTGTRVTDGGLVHLLGLPMLETLSLWGTAVTDAGLVLVGRMPSLRVLGLGRTAVTDSGLVHLRPLTGLRVLQLWGTEVAGPGLVHLHGLQHLEIVTLPWRVHGRHRRRLKRALPGAIVD